MGSPICNGYVEEAWFADQTPAFALVTGSSKTMTQQAIVVHIPVLCPAVPEHKKLKRTMAKGATDASQP